ncbi:glutathione peroxidase [Limnovirga soli]|uniref:Glutathione peroxidase n=1 Tax=Limnovirga soli TaxID=2656915 RepID=A0A8J8F9M5_9BACT|nr:glutathione peroxidase [Limnovirga soli]NNV53861.1 glutathione peroxidase [Limnovirga soli]
MKHFIVGLILTYISVHSLVNLNSAYDYSLPGASDSSEIHLSSCTGKKVLIVSIATGSDHVSQLSALEQLQQQYADSLIVIAAPSNSFGNEQLTDSAIVAFVSENYNATYLISGKVQIAGNEIHPLFQWLSQKTLNGVLNNPIVEDFQKFLIDENGNLIGIFSASVEPLSNEIQDAIKGI